MSLADRIAVFDSGRVRQVDEPVALYERPRSPFVADFVGANNLFHGVASGLEALKSEEFGMLPGTPLTELVGGSAALLAVRPEKIDLADESAVRGLPGSVLDVAFYGGVSHISVGVPGHPKPVLAAVQGAGTVRTGAKVKVRWAAEDAVIMAVDQ